MVVDFLRGGVKFVWPWKHIKGLNDGWMKQFDNDASRGTFLKAAMRPYVYFVDRLHKGFTWKQRWHIFLTGQLPDDF